MGDGLTQCVRETLNMQDAWAAHLPGNWRYTARTAMTTVTNFASFASMHGEPVGRKTGNRWGDALALFETANGGAYYFNLHHGDVANTVVTGPTGLGKTLLVCFLLAMALRYLPRITVYDRKRDSEIFIRRIGGVYVRFQKGVPSGINPCQQEDTIENRAMLCEWVELLLDECSVIQRKLIPQLVDGMYSLPKERRCIGAIREFAEGAEEPNPRSISDQLERWDTGALGWVFPKGPDVIDYDAAALGFDLTCVLGDSTLQGPVLSYLFHRHQQVLQEGKPNLTVLQEGWQTGLSELLINSFRAWLKTLRSQNGGVIFCTQSFGDIADSPLFEDIKDQSATWIALPNHKIDGEKARKVGYTNAEINVVRTLDDTSRCFLLKHGKHSVVVKFDLTGEDDLIAVLSTYTESAEKLDEIRADVGDDPEDWYPLFEKWRLAHAA